MVQERVVLVHGLLMRGPDMALLRMRLRRCGYRTTQFSYPSLRIDIDQVVERLQRQLNTLDEPRINFVCHSLGGLVVRRLFECYPEQRPGRIVTLGSPHNGSFVAGRFGRHPLGRLLLGRSRTALTGEFPAWRAEQPLGVIAGSASMGVGLLVPGLARPNDGTVSVAETRLEGMSEHLLLPVSHMGLLASAEAARACCHFLQRGEFGAAGGKR